MTLPDAFDEVFTAEGLPREHAQALVAEIERLGAERLVAAGALRDAIFMRQGITFDLTSDRRAVADRPFPLDLVPRIIPAARVDARSSAGSRSGSARSTTSSTTSTTSARSSRRGSSRGR